MPVWSPGMVSGVLCADYSQIELHPGDGGHLFGVGDVGLAWSETGDHAVLTTARQFGHLRVAVHMLDEPPELDPSWDAAVEFPFRPGTSAVVTGWAGTGVIGLPIPASVDLRVRYAVIGAEMSWSQPDVQDDDVAPEQYLLQMWRAAQQAPRVVASTSPWSQYWTFGGAAKALLATLADIPDPDRLVVVIDQALAAHPDVAARLRAGEDQYRSGVIRYVQELFLVTYATGAYADVRDDHERLGRLIDERARIGDR